MNCLGLVATSALLVLGCSKKTEPKIEQAKQETATQGPAKEAALLKPQVMVLRQVLVEIGDEVDPHDLESTALAKQLGARLLSSGWLVGDASHAQEGQWPRRVEALIHLSYNITPATAAATGTIVVAIEATISFIDDRNELHPRAALVVEKPLEARASGDVATELRILCEAAIESLAESLVQRERLRVASHEELLSQLSLGIDDAGQHIWALQLAADRSLRDALPAGIAALEHADEDVQAAGISMLVELGDERAISALTSDIDFKDHLKLRVVIEAVSAIGGEDSLEFLEFVASGHPDQDLRQLAKERLESLQPKGKSP